MSKIKFYKKADFSNKMEKIINFLKNEEENFWTKKFIKNISKKMGIKFLGKGVSAYVFQLSPKKVIRIEFEPSSYGYLKWLKYCIKNQDMKSIPKIHMAFALFNDNSCYLITVSELLIPIKGSKVFKDIHGASGLIWQFFDEPNAKMVIFEEIKKNIKVGFQSIIIPQEYVKIKNSMNFLNDLHSENMMLSPDKKRLVITDPISE